MLRDGHLETARRGDRKAYASRERIFAHNNIAELRVVQKHEGVTEFGAGSGLV